MADPKTPPVVPFFGWLKQGLRAGSTPDRLRVLALVSVLVIMAVGTAAWLLTDRLVNETERVAGSTGEVLIATQQISASFAEADAAAVSVHLAGADGNREQRRVYEQAIDRATASLERVSRLVGDDERSHNALVDIASNTTRYTGQIEAARLASIQELDGADALLSEASSLNRSSISPDVTVIGSRARNRFDDETSSAWYAVSIILLVVALTVLLAAMYVLNKRFRRLINLPLLLAMLIVLGLTVISTLGFGTQQAAFTAAEEDAYDAILVSQDVQETAYRHRAVSTASVLAGQAAVAELFDLEEQLARDNGFGLLKQAQDEASSSRERAAATEIRTRWDRYVEQNDRVQVALLSNDLELASDITQGPANSAFNGFNSSVEAALLDNREQFLGQLDRALDSLRWLRGVILVGSLLAAVLTWWGFAQRIGEYR